MNLRKLPDWRERLQDYLDSIKGRPFDWRRHNCAGFVSHCLAAQCGLDPWVDLRAEFEALPDDQAVQIRLQTKYGNLELFIDQALKPYGFSRTTCASAGSPVITLGDNGKLGAGIALGRVTASLSYTGLTLSARTRHVVSWGWP